MSEHTRAHEKDPAVEVPQGEQGAPGPDWTAGLMQKARHYRRLQVTTPEGLFDVAYRARGMGNEEVLVDGEVADRCHSTLWYSPCFRFPVGSAAGELLVRYWPWSRLRSLKLIVDGKVLYTEGSAEARITADELAVLMSERLMSGSAQAVGEQPAVMVPGQNIRCEKHKSGITLSQRWLSWMALVAVPVCVVCDVLVVLAYAYALGQQAPFWIYLLLLPFLLAGLALTYFTLTRFLNRSEVLLTTGQLSIRYRPLPWPGNRQIPVSNVARLYCRETALRNIEGEEWVTYTLGVCLEDGREVDLLSKIGAAGAAHYLEQEVQGWLSTGAQAATSDQPV